MLYKILFAALVAMVLIQNFWIAAEVVALAGLLTVFWERYHRSGMSKGSAWRSLMSWNDRGQSIIELTLMTPLVLVALYVPVDFGIAILKGHLVQNAVRDVARVAANTDPGSFNQTFAEGDLTSRLPAGVTVTSATVSVIPSDPATNCMGTATARATVQYPLFWYRMVGLIGITSPGTTLTITRSTRMRHEKQPDNTTNVFCT